MVLKGMLSGIRAARKGRIPHHTFQNLEYTPFLYGTHHMTHLYKHANEDFQKEMIHDYLHGNYEMKTDVSGIGDYEALVDMIEKDLKIGSHEPVAPKSTMKKKSFNLDDLKDGDNDGSYFPF